MRLHIFALLVLAVLALSGCGGGGGDAGPVTDSHFQVAWPARTRDALAVNLTTAQSARVVFTGAGAGSANVTVDIDRNPAETAAYTGTYTIPGQVFASQLTGVTATFYSQAGQTGVVVGNATATATLNGKDLQFASINVAGTVATVFAYPNSLVIGNDASQMTFTARDANDAVVPVTPGSATWTVLDGGATITLTPDGLVTPRAAGTAYVKVRVDGVESTTTIDVSAPAVFTWANGKGGTMGNPSFSAVEGNQFKVVGGKDVIVTMLGYEADRPTNPGGITAIFDESGAVLAQATITSTDRLMSGYYYQAITPLTLTAGATYYIGSLHGPGANGSCRSETNTALVPAFIQDLGTRFKVSATISGGTWQTSGPRHYVGNFRAYQVP